MNTPATPRNMREAKDRGIAAIAYDPSTMEQYSADPGDYWWMDPDEALTGDDSEPLVLVTRTVTLDPVQLPS